MKEMYTDVVVFVSHSSKTMGLKSHNMQRKLQGLVFVSMLQPENCHKYYSLIQLSHKKCKTKQVVNMMSFHFIRPKPGHSL